MMGFSGSSGGGAADLLTNLLAVLADPTAATKMLVELRDAEAAAEKKIAEADERDKASKAEAEKRLAEADQCLYAAVNREREAAQALADNGAVRAQLAEQEAALQKRKTALAAVRDKIEEDGKVVAARFSTVAERESNVKNREIALTAAEATAELKKRKYEELMGEIDAVRARA